MKLKYLLLLSSSVLLGCTSQPRQVDASLPLVNLNQAPVGEVIDTKYWSQLDSDMYTSLSHSEFDIQLEPAYLSALGLTCRVLTIQNLTSNAHYNQVNAPVKRIACKQPRQIEGVVEQGWYLINNTVETSTVVEI
ncbi:hypothetical protein GT360_13630 [Vibrio astriarenae]|uniref:Lipoprotein n=1 Tax=Vibrio astriarenae TaxID=1481923 RepID=A0A7Z2T568_9VIBR|nr:hypothetical protein [Vibrio astriarenae]QIA64466.1 hypothetical protein GT360_13630 [Vibrio astriarenae]